MMRLQKSGRKMLEIKYCFLSLNSFGHASGKGVVGVSLRQPNRGIARHDTSEFDSSPPMLDINLDCMGGFLCSCR